MNTLPNEEKKHIFLSILSLKTLPFKQKYVSLVALFLDIFFLHCASMTDSQTANSERQKVSELFLLLFFLSFFVPVTLLPVPTSYFPSSFRGIIYHFGVRCPLTLYTLAACGKRKVQRHLPFLFFLANVLKSFLEDLDVSLCLKLCRKTSKRLLMVCSTLKVI